MKRFALFCLLVACAEGGQERVTIALSTSGVPARTVAIAGGELTLTRADVAFGPAYFCASEGARSELCEVALAELRDVVLVRALDPTPQAAGSLSATTGEIRSAMFDYGRYWLLTQSAPQVAPAAPEGHSALLEGTVQRAERTLRFRVAIDIAPRVAGDSALNAQRTRHVVAGERERLAVFVDPHRWVERLDADALFALDQDGDGSVTVEPGTVAYESILQGMTSRAPATFAWSQ